MHRVSRRDLCFKGKNQAHKMYVNMYVIRQGGKFSKGSGVLIHTEPVALDVAAWKAWTEEDIMMREVFCYPK